MPSLNPLLSGDQQTQNAAPSLNQTAPYFISTGSRLVDRIRNFSPQMRPSSHAFDSHHHDPNRAEHDEELNRLWLIVRYLKVGEIENRFELRGGEKIRIGRVIFTVKEIVSDKFQFMSDIGDSASRNSEDDIVDMEDLN